MIKVGWNYGNKSKCPLCTEDNDDQQHLLNCTKLTDNNTDTHIHTNFISHDDNLNNRDSDSDWDSIYRTLKRLEKAIRRRDVILEEQNRPMSTNEQQSRAKK